MVSQVVAILLNNLYLKKYFFDCPKSVSLIVIIVKTTRGEIDMLSEEMLKQAAEELALAMTKSLPAPEECQHQFSNKFEKKMQLLLSSVSFDTQTDGKMKKP